jgi:serine/threonine-protein kinase
MADELREETCDGYLVSLTVTDGPEKGRRFTFATRDTFVLGRAPDCHFVLGADDTISRHHCLLEINPPRCRVHDLRSKNHTHVNDVKDLWADSADLVNGDRVRAGRTIFTVSVEQPGGNEVRRNSRQQYDTQPPGPGFPVVPGYHITHELGRGNMGIVYLAERPAGTLFALKTVLPETHLTCVATERFLREARILQGLRHPNIVAFLDMGEANGLLYFAMEYVSGTNAGTLLKSGGPLAIGRAVALICQVLDALAYAHAQGFVHRDVKPSNFLVTTGAGREIARLADFGLARAYQASSLSGLTRPNALGGTPGFMPPEQIVNFRDVKPAADQYAAAATLYNLLTGKLAHGASDSFYELCLKILNSELVDIRSVRPDIPDGLAKAIHRALAREPRDRFEDVSVFRSALMPFQGP